MSNNPLLFPQVILFDWHGTLANTLESMYQAIEEMLPQLEELGLTKHLVPEELAKTDEDEKLLRYIRIFHHLHPRVLAEQRVSRTDIFDAIFGDNDSARSIAHQAYNKCYRTHYGKVTPYQGGIFSYIDFLKSIGIKVGVVTNRSREFLSNELAVIDEGRWVNLFDLTLCGDEAKRYKPAPDGIIEACKKLGYSLGKHVWYVGDSVTDMITAEKAGVSSIFYNGAHWEHDWFLRMFPEAEVEHHKPDAIVDNFDQLIDLLAASQRTTQTNSKTINIEKARPARHPSREPLPLRDEPDWHPAIANLTPPTVILFDWHATLVDTLDAMYHAVDDMLKEIREMGLIEHLVSREECRSPDDYKLVEYVINNMSLHPKVKLDRKISRTDIFEVLFGDNDPAKKIAHQGFTKHYRNYYGTALPFEPKVKHVLEGLRSLGLRIGVITNRDREFFVDELSTIEGTGWQGLFETEICGDDTEKRKPHTDQIVKAAENLGCSLDASIWYVGDSTTDVISAKSAGITSVFFNGAMWDQPWLNKIFPGSQRYPHKPDVVVNDFSEFWAMVLACQKKKTSF